MKIKLKTLEKILEENPTMTKGVSGYSGRGTGLINHDMIKKLGTTITVVDIKHVSNYDYEELYVHWWYKKAWVESVIEEDTKFCTMEDL